MLYVVHAYMPPGAAARVGVLGPPRILAPSVAAAGIRRTPSLRKLLPLRTANRDESVYYSLPEEIEDSRFCSVLGLLGERNVS